MNTAFSSKGDLLKATHLLATYTVTFFHFWYILGHIKIIIVNILKMHQVLLFKQYFLKTWLFFSRQGKRYKTEKKYKHLLVSTNTSLKGVKLKEVYLPQR